MLYKFNEFNDFKDIESISRSKPLSEEEFLQLLNENCKNFSFDNDQLWRNKDFDYDMSIFIESERRCTIGTYNYKDFFDNRKGYPVPRYKSLIGSTTIKGCETFSTTINGKTYLIIPFDKTQIVFSPSPDMAILDRAGVKEYNDDMFIMKEYTKDFKIPNDILDSKCEELTGGHYYKIKGYGFEFFTNGPCLLLNKDKIDWLKSFL